RYEIKNANAQPSQDPLRGWEIPNSSGRARAKLEASRHLRHSGRENDAISVGVDQHAVAVVCIGRAQCERADANSVGGLAACAGPVPGVESEMVVVIAAGEECGAEAWQGDFDLEPDNIPIERDGAFEVGDVKVHVSNVGLWIEPGPGCVACGGEEGVAVEWWG